MRELGLNYDPYLYEESDEESEDEDCDLLSSVDKVDVAGAINNNQVLAAAKALGVAALMLAPQLMTQGMRGIVSSWPRTAEGKLRALTPHPTDAHLAILLTLLASWGILKDVTDLHGTVLAICAVFVVKKAGNKLRVIYDGRPVNENVRNPPPVALPSISECLQKIADMKPKHIFLCDFRHFFHQISLPADAHTLFGTACNGKFYQCRTLLNAFVTRWKRRISLSFQKGLVLLSM